MESTRTHQIDRAYWIKRAILLSWFTIVYNLLEGIVAIDFGLSDDSVALAGFGIDSLIEVASAILILWRFRAETGTAHALSTQKEKRVTFEIGVLFILLALITGAGSAVQLTHHSHPETTLPGIVVSCVSLSFMFYLWTAKKKAGSALDSRSVLQDAACSMACIKLSFVLFAGSLLFMTFPTLWWIDSAAALVISGFIFREGWEAIQATREKDFTGGCCGSD